MTPEELDAIEARCADVHPLQEAAVTAADAPWKRQSWGIVAHHVTSDGGTLCGLRPDVLREWLPPVPGDQPDRTSICAHCQWVDAGKPLGPM